MLLIIDRKHSGTAKLKGTHPTSCNQNTHQITTPFCLNQDIKVHYSKVKLFSYLQKFKYRSHITLYTNQYPGQILTSYTLQLPSYCPDKILTVTVTTARSNQYHTVMWHIYFSKNKNVSTKYKLPMPHSFCDAAWANCSSHPTAHPPAFQAGCHGVNTVHVQALKAVGRK